MIQWNKINNTEMAVMIGVGVGTFVVNKGRHCGVVLMIGKTENGWLWSVQAGGLAIQEDASTPLQNAKAAKSEAESCLPRIWQRLRNQTIKNLNKKEPLPPITPSWL